MLIILSTVTAAYTLCISAEHPLPFLTQYIHVLRSHSCSIVPTCLCGVRHDVWEWKWKTRILMCNQSRNQLLGLHCQLSDLTVEGNISATRCMSITRCTVSPGNLLQIVTVVLQRSTINTSQGQKCPQFSENSTSNDEYLKKRRGEIRRKTCFTKDSGGRLRTDVDSILIRDANVFWVKV